MYALIDTVVNKDNEVAEPAVSDRFCTGRHKIIGGEGPFYCWISMMLYGNKAHNWQF